jgi:integrase
MSQKGSIRKRGTTHTAYWFTIDPGTGQRVQHTKGGFRTKGAAQSHLNDVLGKIEANEWTADKKTMTVEQLLSDWLAAKKSEGLRPSTVAQYSKIIDAWVVPHIGAVKVVALSPQHAQKLLDSLRRSGGRNGSPLSSRSVQLAAVVLKAATRWAVETRLVGRDPLLGFKRPRATATKDATSAWTMEEARTFLASVADDRLVAAWTLLLTRGLRRGELAGLRWDAIDLDGQSLSITRTRVLVDGKPVESEPKTEAGKRRVPLDDRLVAALRSHWARQGEERLAVGETWNEGDYVFTDELGAPLNPEYFSTRFETLTNRAGVRRVRLHDLRHTAASQMIAVGVSPKVVAELLGHASPVITQTVYQHVMPGMSESAGERLSAALLG